MIGMLYLDHIFGIAAAGDHAFITTGAYQLEVVRLPDLAVAGQVALPGPGWSDVAAGGGYAYVASLQGQLAVVDVSMPSAPQIVSVTATPDAARAVAVQGNVAVVGGNASFLVYDVTAPVPVLLGSLPFDARTNDVAIAGSYAFVTGEGAVPGGLAIVDISDPGSPVLAGTPLSGDGQAVEARGTRVYIGSSAGFLSIDASVPSAPIRVGRVGGPATDVAVSGTMGYMVTPYDGLLRMIDVTYPTSPPTVGGLGLPGRTLGVARDGNLAYLAGEAGFQVADISDPHQPTLLASVPGNATDVALTGHHAIVVDQTIPSLEFYDVTEPMAPMHVAALPMPYPVGSIDAEGPLACAAMGIHGLAVVDVSDPASPSIAATIEDRAWDVELQGTMAAYGSGDIEGPGCVLVDLSNPASPVVLTAGGHPGGIGVHLAGQHLYHTWTDAYFYGYEAYLDIYDIADPTSPTHLGGIRLPADGGRVDAVSTDGCAYVQGGGLGLYVLDVSSPSAPAFIGNASAPTDLVFEASLAGDVVITAAGWDGLQVFPLQCSAVSVPAVPPAPDGAVRLRLAGANPASGSARFEADLPAGTAIRVAVYDALGRRVRKLFAGPVGAGSHAYTWDGRDDRARAVACGVYFLRLTTPAGDATARVVWGR